MLIHNFLENSAARYPKKIAVIHGDQRIAYQDLNTQAGNLAAHLQSNGIAKGDRIALLLENGVDYIIAYYATLKAGAVAAPLNPVLKPDGLRELLNRLEPARYHYHFQMRTVAKSRRPHRFEFHAISYSNSKTHLALHALHRPQTGGLPHPNKLKELNKPSQIDQLVRSRLHHLHIRFRGKAQGCHAEPCEYRGQHEQHLPISGDFTCRHPNGDTALFLCHGQVAAQYPHRFRWNGRH